MSGQAGHIGDGGPAFPVPDNVAWDESEPTAIAGMSLRDYFAAKAMQGLLVKPNECTGVVGVNMFEHLLAKSSYKIADAMLEARDR